MADNYLVVGEEAYLVTKKVDELCRRFAGGDDWAVEKLPSWSQAMHKLFNLGLFSDRRVFVINYADIVDDKPDVQQLGSALDSHNNVVIIYYLGNPDRRTKLYKSISKQVELVQLKAPRGNELRQWVVQRARDLGADSIDASAASELVFLAGSNMATLDNEIQKLVNYSPSITSDSVRRLAARDIQAGIFDLVDAVVKGNIKQAMLTVELMMKGGAQVPYLLFMLARQYRQLFTLNYYRSKGYGSSEIQKLMPMHPYAFSKLTQQASNLSCGQCAASLQLLAEADYSFKTGRHQGISMMQGLVIKIAKK